MPAYDDKYVHLDGAWHLIGEDEHTHCGLVVPPLTDWLREAPDNESIHCGPDQTVDKPKAAKPSVIKGKKK